GFNCTGLRANGTTPISLTNVLSITLANGDTAVCAITNNDIAPLLKVVKSLVPSTDTGRFNLTIDGTHYTSSPNDPAGDGDATAFIPVTANVQHTIGETAVAPALAANYITTYGAPCDSTGHITLGVGASATCTVTNTRKGQARVIKTVNPGGSQ